MIPREVPVEPWSRTFHRLRDLPAEQVTIFLRQMLDDMQHEAAEGDTLAKLHADVMITALPLMLATDAQLPHVLEIVRQYERICATANESGDDDGNAGELRESA